MGVDALLDSGATGLFIDSEFVEAKNLTTQKLPRAIQVYNIDGTLNEHGSVTHTVDLVIRYQDHTERAVFYVTQLGGVPLILGHPWLVQHNPEIDWATGKVLLSRCPTECRIGHIQAQRKRRLQQRARRKLSLKPSIIQATTTPSQRFAESSEKEKLEKSFEELVPKHYHSFQTVFSKDSFDALPPRKKWDDAIELIPGSEPFSSKLYPMSQPEQEELRLFLEENLASGRI